MVCSILKMERKLALFWEASKFLSDIHLKAILSNFIFSKCSIVEFNQKKPPVHKRVLTFVHEKIIQCMSLLKKLAGETAIYGLSSILSRVLNYFILVPYLTRRFLTGEYGVINIYYTGIALLLILFTYRMETAFFRFGSKKEGDLDKSFSTAAISLLLSTGVFLSLLLLFQHSIADWMNRPEHPEYVFYSLLIIGLDALAAIPMARLRLENRPLRFAAVRVAGIIVNIIFIFFFLEFCPIWLEQGQEWVQNIYQEENRVAYIFLSNVLGSGAVLFLLLPLYAKIKWSFDTALWRKMLIYAAPLIIAGIAGVINQLIGIPLIDRLASDDPAYNESLSGIYAAAAKLAVLMNLFTQAFNYAAEPFFFRHSEQNDTKRVYAQVAQAFTLVGSLVFLGIMLYLDIIQLFLGKDFRQGLGVAPILLIAYLFLGLFYNFSIWYKITDRTIIGGYIAVGGAVITLSINLLFIPTIGYYAPAWAALACYGFMAITSYSIGRRYYPVDYPMGRIALYILLAVAVFGISLWLEQMIKGGLLLKMAINTALLLTYLVVIFLVDKQKILALFPSRVESRESRDKSRKSKS